MLTVSRRFTPIASDSDPLAVRSKPTDPTPSFSKLLSLVLRSARAALRDRFLEISARGPFLRVLKMFPSGHTQLYQSGFASQSHRFLQSPTSFSVSPSISFVLSPSWSSVTDSIRPPSASVSTVRPARSAAVSPGQSVQLRDVRSQLASRFDLRDASLPIGAVFDHCQLSPQP